MFATHLIAEEPPHMLLKRRLVQLVIKQFITSMDEVHVHHICVLCGATLPQNFRCLCKHRRWSVRIIQT